MNHKMLICKIQVLCEIVIRSFLICACSSVFPEDSLCRLPVSLSAIREAAVGDGAAGAEQEEAQAGVLPHQGGPAVPLPLPDGAGQPRGRVGLRGDDRRRLRGLGNGTWAVTPSWRPCC